MTSIVILTAVGAVSAGPAIVVYALLNGGGQEMRRVAYGGVILTLVGLAMLVGELMAPGPAQLATAVTLFAAIVATSVIELRGSREVRSEARGASPPDLGDDE